MGKWISVEDRKPREGQNVLLLIIYQQMIGGIYSEDEIIITGGIKDGGWFVGNDMIIWDYEYNLGFTDDDVTHWMELPQTPN